MIPPHFGQRPSIRLNPAAPILRIGVMVRFVALVLLVVPLVSGATSAHPPLQMASSVDIPKFMGDWYVIGNIPTRIERNAGL
jgi:lipocalin